MLWIKNDQSVIAIAIVSLTYYALVAVSEEVLFRGMLSRITEEGLGTWIALMLSALIFRLFHLQNEGATLWSSVAIAIESGVLFGVFYTLTRALWLPIGLHWMWNYFQGYVYGTPVSGNGQLSLVASSITGPSLWTGGTFGAGSRADRRPTMRWGGPCGDGSVRMAAQHREPTADSEWACTRKAQKAECFADSRSLQRVVMRSRPECQASHATPWCWSSRSRQPTARKGGVNRPQGRAKFRQAPVDEHHLTGIVVHRPRANQMAGITGDGIVNILDLVTLMRAVVCNEELARRVRAALA